MAIILNLETATTNCSVSIAHDGEILSLIEEDHARYSHSEQLHNFIERSMEEAKVKPKDLDAVAVSKGPGSYTGLRIGVSTAKGLCYALDIPMISVSTLESLASSVSVESGYVIPLLDARRMEVYAAVFDHKGKLVKPTWAEVIDQDSFREFMNEETVYLLGNGSIKCREVLQGANLKYLPELVPSAKTMSGMSYKAYENGLFENTAYFEPFYLKDFIAMKPKNPPS
ncbi:MAG: tRNA (adenosine(37)-N6)-threonylcarbamoyltransferase complex dimerization subunit type 1 TsaB [Flavobacteriaceae bacterium]